MNASEIKRKGGRAASAWPFFSRYDRYAATAILSATLFITLVLAFVILLVQSLRFLELVIEAGASPGAFITLSLLALPRFFEMILPVALVAGILFVFQRMRTDSELIVLPAVGLSPLQVARPALMVAGIVAVILFTMTGWLAPKTLSAMQQMRQMIKAEYSTLLLREGVFNTLGSDVTVYVGKRHADGALEGVLIYDQRPENPAPVTVTARRGVLALDDEKPQVIVYDGVRQDVAPATGVLRRLQFDRYQIDLPDGGPVRQRWREPEERTLWELMTAPDRVVENTDKNTEFTVEIHRRLASLFLAPAFALVALIALLTDQFDRRQSMQRTLIAVGAVIGLLLAYLSGYSMAREGFMGFVLMYGAALVPAMAGLIFFWREQGASGPVPAGAAS